MHNLFKHRGSLTLTSHLCLCPESFLFHSVYFFFFHFSPVLKVGAALRVYISASRDYTVKDTKNIRTSLKGVALKYNPQVLLARQGFRAPVAAGVRSRVKHNGTTPF